MRGAALRPDDIRANFTLLRELGANMTRSHYPMHPLALELADRYGIVVWSEVPVYQMRDQLFRSAAVRAARRAAGPRHGEPRPQPPVGDRLEPRQREHLQAGPRASRAMCTAAARLARRLDPTRLVGLAFPGYPTVGKQDLYTKLDALGRERLLRLVRRAAGVDHRPRGPRRPTCSGCTTTIPRQALFVTEFGAEANRSGPADREGHVRVPARLPRISISNVIGQMDFLNGALVWILRDFRVKPGYDGGNPQPRPPYNTKGLVDETGARKPSFDAVKRLFRNQP